ASSLVLPASSPASTRSERTQLRSVSPLMPSCSPTSRQARETGNPGSSAIRSRTSLTARSRSSSGYFLGAGMTPSSWGDHTLHHSRGDPSTEILRPRGQGHTAGADHAPTDEDPPHPIHPADVDRLLLARSNAVVSCPRRPAGAGPRAEPPASRAR